MKRTFLTDFLKCLNINFHENTPVGTKLFHADRRTDRRTAVKKLTVTFLQSFNAPKNELKLPAVKYKVMQEIKL